MTNEFKATHVLTVRYWNRITENIPVLRVGDSLYTEAEWAATDAADWTVNEDGDILFQGKVPVCLVYGLIAVSSGWTLQI